MLKNPEIERELLVDVQQLGVVGERLLSLQVYVVAVSRLLAKPLHLCVRAASSSGKSYVTTTILKLIPEWAIWILTSATPKAFFHMVPGSLIHKVVFVAERPHLTKDPGQQANSSLAIREMMSSGKLCIAVTVACETGGFETQIKEQEGPISYIETTTQEEIFSRRPKSLPRHHHGREP